MSSELQIVRYNGNEIHVEAADFSSLSPFPFCLILLPTLLVGTHEYTGPADVGKIDLSNGWYGKPIAVTANANGDSITQLDSGVYIVKQMSYGDFGVLDGHHRLEAAKQAQLTYVVAQFFSLHHAALVIDTWANYTPSWDEIIKCFKNKDEHFPPKTTKFQAIGTDHRKRRLSAYQPTVEVPLSVLRS